MVSSYGLPDSLAKPMWRVPISGCGISGRAISRNELVAFDGRPTEADAVPELVEAGLSAAMAAPVHDNGHVAGSLLVASHQPNRVYSAADREILLAFAEHVSLAVTDAKTLEAMYQAFHDSLTGLASRSLFMDRVAHALALGTREKGGVAVLFIDLDRFKMVNDTLDTRPAICCWSRSVSGCAPACALPTPPHASAATNSPCSCRTRRPRPRPKAWPNGSSKRSAPPS